MPRGPRSRGGGDQARQRHTAAQRRLVRSRLGPLRDRQVTAQTLGNYRRATAQFFRWLDAMQLPTPSDCVSFDNLLARFAQELWQEGEPRGLLANVLCGLTLEVP